MFITTPWSVTAVKPAITSALRTGLKLLVWGLVANLLLVAPLWLRFGFDQGRWLAWEAWFLVALFALLPDRAGIQAVRWVSVALLLMALVLGLSDAATQQILSRPLNIYFDIVLISASFHLLDGNLGPAAALGVFAGVLISLVVLALILGRALNPGRAQGRAGSGVATLIVIVSFVMGALEVGGQRLLSAARTPAWDTLSFQLDQALTTHRARVDFTATAPPAERPATALAALAETDVLLVFVESYGMTVFDLERYRQIVEPSLERMEEKLSRAGVTVVTGVLDAPVRGGQSWLAHATALSGRWIDNQLWYRLLLESTRNTLVDDFRATGHHTVAVVPAITMPWPEGRQLGYDRIFAARDLGYAGPPLNWVTMPDQFTLHQFQKVLRPPAARPLFAKIALISSHAPWTPVLDVLTDWATIGDGSVFEAWRNAGDPPQLLWQNIERVRDHYAMSVEYSLHVSLDYAARFLDDDTLMILLGDHQPAALITGHEASGAVPVHVLARDPARLQAFRDRGFVSGLIPDYQGSAPRMDQLRDWLHEDFGKKSPAQTSRTANIESKLRQPADAISRRTGSADP